MPVVIHEVKKFIRFGLKSFSALVPSGCGSARVRHQVLPRHESRNTAGTKIQIELIMLRKFSNYFVDVFPMGRGIRSKNPTSQQRSQTYVYLMQKC